MRKYVIIVALILSMPNLKAEEKKAELTPQQKLGILKRDCNELLEKLSKLAIIKEQLEASIRGKSTKRKELERMKTEMSRKGYRDFKSIDNQLQTILNEQSELRRIIIWFNEDIINSIENQLRIKQAEIRNIESDIRKAEALKKL